MTDFQAAETQILPERCIVSAAWKSYKYSQRNVVVKTESEQSIENPIFSIHPSFKSTQIWV
jgi:hypothetical protein